jgi:PHD/YefM family antitoxin component YafN of YafNO toxin-antitoxin module
MSWNLYESMIETMEILGDADLVSSLKKGAEDLKAGRVYSIEDVEKDLGL